MLSERFKERILDVDITANWIVSQRTHAKKITAFTSNFDLKARP
jgi:hypothetical protein